MMVKCHVCEYSWSFKGKLSRATCPNCGAKCSIDKCSITEEKIIENKNIKETTHQ